MIRSLFPLLAASLIAMPALAEVDLAKGEKEFGKCKACHRVEAPDGTVIAKGNKTGPNLYGIIGRKAGEEDYKYSAGLTAAAEKGLVWDEANLVEFLVDPNAFVQTFTGDATAKSAMTFKMKKNGEHVAAWLKSVGPAAE